MTVQDTIRQETGSLENLITTVKLKWYGQVKRANNLHDDPTSSHFRQEEAEKKNKKQKKKNTLPISLTGLEDHLQTLETYGRSW